MAKAKNKKKQISDKVRGKKKEAVRKINPFEVKINKQKHHVLGKKTTKFDKGMPGVSRSKAIKKRKETLLVEYKQRGKANNFVDKRIGEGDSEMSVEEKMLRRFAREKARTHEKAGLFSLNEEEELTHYGQSLSAVEKFEEPEQSDSDDDDVEKGLFAKMVGDEHFGGFLTKKAEELDADGRPKTWKQRMEEIILKSKKEKYERKHEKEQNKELTEKLDKEYKQLLGSLSKGSKMDRSEKKAPVDDYDITVRELMFEARGKATDRMKTDEEIAKEEKERLDKLEADRVRRMKGLTLPEYQESEQKHRSADGLDKGSEADVEESEGEEEEQEEGGSDGDSDAEDGDDEEAKDEEGSSDEDAMQHVSDLDSSDDEDDAETSEAKPSAKSEPAPAKGKKGILKNFKEDLKKKKTVMEEARKELPYTFEAPETYEDLVNLLLEYSEDDQLVVIDRLRKCHHPSLAEGNKEKLQTLFALLFEYLGEVVTQDPPQLRLADRLTRHLYELSQQSPVPAGRAVRDLIAQRHAAFLEYCETHGGRGVFPTLDLLLQLKTVSLLFPTSDMYHHVVTPTMLLMSQLITQIPHSLCIQCPISTRRDISSGLFVCNLFLQYVSFSKRFVPEAINFLCGVLFLAIKKSPVGKTAEVEPVIPPFKPFGRNVNFLELQKPKLAGTVEVEAVKLSDVFSRSKASFLSTDKFRLCTVHQAVVLLHKFARLYSHLPSFAEIFKPVTHFCDKLPVDVYPSKLKEAIRDLTTAIHEHASTHKLSHLVLESAKPKPLKQFEPKFDEVFDGRKKRSGSKEQIEKQRLIHKHKREMKGAMREIRKDSQFLARQRLNERIEKDSERKRKVKEIYGMLANQEGDYKALKRKK